MPAQPYPLLRGLLEELKLVEGRGGLEVKSVEDRAMLAYLTPGDAVDLIVWPGAGRFWLKGPQRAVGRLLLAAYIYSQSPELGQRALLAAARSRAAHLREVFTGSSAWGVLIVAGSEAGTYRLAPLPEARDEPDIHVEPCEG